jgi:nucleoid-associated protein YgaU
MSASAVQAAGGGGHTYTVESGDNLTKIGAKYGLTWQQVFDANKDIISDPDKIFPGQELKIPGA